MCGNEMESGTVYYISGNTFLAERIKRRIEKLDQEISNTKEALALVKTAEQALARVELLLHLMRSYAVQAADPRCQDRLRLAAKMSDIRQEIDQVVAEASYKGINLLDGSLGNIGGVLKAIDSTMK